MVTRTANKTVKKVSKIVSKKPLNGIVLTLGQARSIQNFLVKKNKAFKFLDNKIIALA